MAKSRSFLASHSRPNRTVTRSPIVSVTVRDPLEHHETHTLHFDLLCLESEYFSACLQGKFQEASSLEVQLPDVKPYLFGLFVQWLYTEDLAPFAKDMTDDAIAEIMVDTYVLGDRLLCSGLKNRAMDILQEVLKDAQCEVQLAMKVIALGGSLRGSPLLGYLLEQTAYNIALLSLDEYIADFVEREEWLEFIKALDADEVTNLMVRCQRYQAPGVSDDIDMTLDPAKVEGCRWHEHTDRRSGPCQRWASKSLRLGHDDSEGEEETDTGENQETNDERTYEQTAA